MDNEFFENLDRKDFIAYAKEAIGQTPLEIKLKKLDKNAIFTHNCGARIVAGRLEQTASMMALGSTLGTTVDGSHKGWLIILRYIYQVWTQLIAIFSNKLIKLMFNYKI